MTVRQPRLSKEEHARLGIAIYEQQVRPQVEEWWHYHHNSATLTQT